jgi:hypothetical protein
MSKTNNNLPWVKGNAKLNKITGALGEHKIIGFGIPADTSFVDGKRNRNTCPGAEHCREVCYAKQGTFLFNNVKAARLRALQSTMSANFVQDAISDLKRLSKRYTTVRVHDAGDFYSQEYLEKWYDIARMVPEMSFYAYTKSLNLDLWTNKPDNFQLIQSLGGKWDRKVDLSKPHSRIFTDHDAREANGYVDGNINDLPAIEGAVKIGLVYHGVKSLTEEQKKRYSLPVVTA